MRARRIDVRRQEGRRRLNRLVALGIVAAVIVAGYLVTRSAVLDVDHVEIVGANHTGVAAVRMATAILPHQPMTDVDLDRARHNVLALPWVRTVSVQRKWPSSIRVVVTERVPVAAVADGSSGFALVDGTGLVLETSTAPPPGFVVIDGLPAPGAPGSVLDPASADGLRVAGAIPIALVPKVASIATTPAGVDVKLAAGGVAHLGQPTELGAKFVALDTLLADADTARVCAIDVRVPSAPSLTRTAPCA